MKKKIIWIIIIFFFILVFIGLYNKFLGNEEKHLKINNTKLSEEIKYSSNTFQDVNYSSTDSKGNEYIIQATKGEVDIANPNIIFLDEVTALIKLNDSGNIEIKSDYGRYNSENFDTIFSKNVNIDYLEHNITGEYLDFSINRNSMIISRNVIYNSLENILKADEVDIEIDSKNVKIYMHNIKEKINIYSKNKNGNN